MESTEQQKWLRGWYESTLAREYHNMTNWDGNIETLSFEQERTVEEILMEMTEKQVRDALEEYHCQQILSADLRGAEEATSHVKATNENLSMINTMVHVLLNDELRKRMGNDLFKPITHVGVDFIARCIQYVTNCEITLQDIGWHWNLRSAEEMVNKRISIKRKGKVNFLE